MISDGITSSSQLVPDKLPALPRSQPKDLPMSKDSVRPRKSSSKWLFVGGFALEKHTKSHVKSP